MDQQGTDHDALLADLKNHLHENCVDFGKTEGAEEGFSSEQMENIAVCDEKLLEKYLETGEVTVAESAALIAQRKVFPCFFGSALKGRRGRISERTSHVYERTEAPGNFWCKSFQDCPG